MAKVSEPGSYFLRGKAGDRRLEVGPPRAPIALDGPWTLRDGEKKMVLDKLKSWTEVDGYRFFSGRLDYEFSVDIPPEAVGAGRGLWLDLGEVREIAEVHINGELAESHGGCPTALT